MNKYRVFVTRHYIAVEYYDIEAPTAKEAQKAAVKAAKHFLPDVRAIATDNGWIADEAIDIPELGFSASGFNVHEIIRRTSMKGTSIVYAHPD